MKTVDLPPNTAVISNANLRESGTIAVAEGVLFVWLRSDVKYSRL